METRVLPLMSDVVRLVRRVFDARARDIGITRPQWQVLSVLGRHEGVNQGGLADLLEVEPITVCRMVDRLQEGDLVERRPDPADRRSWRLFLTARGAAIIAQLRPLADEVQAVAFEGIVPRDQAVLADLLEQVRGNLTRRPAPRGEEAHHG